jgi:hypothetical protein
VIRLSLSDLTLLDEYRSSTHNLVEDFYIPCLTHATRYDRAVGYFTSAAMTQVAQGLTAFIRSGGRMRLVTSPQLLDEDVEAIAQGLQQREQVITAALLRELDRELPQILEDRLESFFWEGCR